MKNCMPDVKAPRFRKTTKKTVVKEMVDMITATRAYEANVSVISSTKSMMSQAISISSVR